MNGFLILEDGTVFRGDSVAAQGFAFGEAVFTTAMTGYQEVVTDPSYAEQVVVFSAPMVGNYGVASGRCDDRILRRSEVAVELQIRLDEGDGVVHRTHVCARRMPPGPAFASKLHR